ncbi:golgi-body localization protein domain-containing protein [Spinellus fusiger]|nr:golgi-body localization protein domain-containing protein [Spinellus fusiger]
MVWADPELIIDQSLQCPKNIHRIASKLDINILHDAYNHLHIKNDANALSSQCFDGSYNSLHVHCSSIDITVNSAQYNAIIDILLPRFLHKSTSRQQELKKNLNDMIITIDYNDLSNIDEKFMKLQDTLRYLIQRLTFYQAYTLLSDADMKEYKALKLLVQEYLDEVYLLTELVKAKGSTRQFKRLDQSEVTSALMFSANQINLEILMENDLSLGKTIMKNILCSVVQNEDTSSIKTIEIGKMKMLNTSPPPVIYPCILDIYNDSQKPLSSHQKILRLRLVSLPPVGGMSIHQQLEINLLPLHVQLSYDFGRSIVSFFFPSEKSHVQEGGTMTGGFRGDRQDFYASRDVTKESAVQRNKEYTLVGNTTVFDVADKSIQSEKEIHPITESTDDLSVMRDRASKRQIFIHVKLTNTVHCLSYKVIQL